MKKLLEDFERRYEWCNSIFQGSGDAMRVIDLDFKVVQVNDEMGRFTGVPADDCQGLHCYDHFCGERCFTENCSLRLVLGGKKRLQVETEKQFAESRKTPVEMIVTPLIQNGKIAGVIESFRDITQHRKDKEALREAKRKAQEANEAKTEFLANMSHEIRTPMNAIVGFTDMALATDLTDEQHEFILAANHASATLLGLINDILDFSKIEAGKFEIDHLEFNLQEMISRLASINQGRIKEKDLEFVQIVPPLDRMLIGDPARLQQILTNLIGNAIKFTSQGRITLEVRMREQSGETITLDFAVSDTGIGIAEEKQASIFEAFTQADGSVTRDFGGIGLGLTISNQLVGLLGGTTLKVSSRQGEGSTFSFELPFRLGRKIGAESGKAEKAEKQSEKITACRILLVEDMMLNAELARMLLEEQGHRVTVAENGKLGVEAAFNDEYDLILMDMVMPEMDGLTATREIRRREQESATVKRHVPIIAITANAMKGDREKCIEAGMDDYFTKPIKIEMINQVIGQCLTDHKNNGRITVPAEAKPGKTILVVDDNMVNCKLLSAGLKKEGFEVLTVHDGQQAVDTYQQEKIDVILMDIQMPVMDGLEATRQIRGLEAESPERSRIPIVAITAHAGMDECLAAGMDKGHKKPVKIAALVIDIENLLKP